MKLDSIDYRNIMQRDLMAFISRVFMELNPGDTLELAPYLEVIASALMRCRNGKTRRLIINVPPRHLKSICTSIAFVAWFLGHHPDAETICVSYGQDLSDKLARDCRRVMESAWYQRIFPTRLAGGPINDFVTTRNGTRKATSVGGSLTGRGADLIIIDDPLKPDEAMSLVRRTATNEWYRNSLLSRLNNKTTGIIIVVMQRLHQDDLVGHVLEMEDWEVVSLPAIAEGDEQHLIESPWGNRLWRRSAGGVLCPEREPFEKLQDMRRTMGLYDFAAQYQQSPVPPGGAIVLSDWLQHYTSYDLPERFSSIVQSWDTANKDGEFNDYSVCTTWGRMKHPDLFYLLDVYRERLNYPELRRVAKEQYKKHRPKAIVVEDHASGTQLIQDLKQDRVLGVRAYKPPTGNDKRMRLYNQTSVFENGQVLLPKGASWLADYVRELTSFPGSRYDDQVDSTSQALEWMRSHDTSTDWTKM